MTAPENGEHVPVTEREAFAEKWARLSRLSMQVCPNCGTELGHGVCCNMSWTEWHCFGCGANLDSRVVSPRTVMRCEDEWPDYKRQSIIDTIHPLACSCTGRGWHEWPVEVSGG